MKVEIRSNAGEDGEFIEIHDRLLQRLFECGRRGESWIIEPTSLLKKANNVLLYGVGTNKERINDARRLLEWAEQIMGF